MRVFLLVVVLFVQAAPSQAQTYIRSMSFLPGSSALGPNDGLVLIDFISKGQDRRGLLCDTTQRNIEAKDICYTLGYAQKGTKTVWKGTLSSLNNVPTYRLGKYSCAKPATDANYLKSCAFGSFSCPDYQLLAVACVEPRGLTTTPPPTLPTLAPVNCSKGASANIRLMDSNNKAVVTTGRVEIRSANKWHTVCNYDFQNKQASFVCAMLCSSGADPKAVSGPNTGVSPTVVLTCPSAATDLSGCSVDQILTKPDPLKQQCKEKDVAYVQCTAPTEAPPGSTDPVAEVNCRDNLATVTFNKTVNPGLTNSSLIMHNSGIAQANCFFNVTDTGSEIVVVFTFSLCGGTMDFTPNATIFKNTLMRMSSPVNGVFTQANMTFAILCTLSKTVDVDTGDVSGKTQVGKPFGGTDNPTVNMALYRDEKMTNVIRRGQKIDVKPSTRIYVMVTETSNIEHTQMAIRSCWLTPTNDPNIATRQDLIVDGCKHPTYLKQLIHVDDMTQKFVFQPILFPGYQTFYLHCNTKTCAKTDTSVACSRSCTNTKAFASRRRKRSVDNSELLKALAAQGVSPRTQTLDRGPFYATGIITTGSGVMQGSVLLLLAACLLALTF